MHKRRTPQSNEKLEELHHVYLQTFKSPAGVAVLDDLRATYGGSPMRTDPYSTAYNVGCQDVIKYIENVINEALEVVNNADG